MENENVTDTARRVTANQIVAWNLAWHRKIAGLTQQDLGDMIGWTNAAVSEAERSWTGKRTREFDAQTLVTLATALGIPLIALFLPPEEGDGQFAVLAGHAELGMTGLTLLAMPDSDDDTPVMEEYRKRLTRAVERWLDVTWARDLTRWQMTRESREVLAARAERLRARGAIFLEHAEEAVQQAAAIEEALVAGEDQ